MKFQTALLLIATTSFALANSLELSDAEEDFAPANVVDEAGINTGINSEPEGLLDTEADIPDYIPEDNADVEIPVEPPLAEDNADVASNDVAPDNETLPDETTVTGETPDETIETGETPDESIVTGETPEIAEGDNQEIVNGEASDDYGDDNEIANVDGADLADNEVSDAENANADVEAEGVAAADAEVNEDSADEDDSSSDATIAAGIAGAAALSSAGIFLWVKRSKRTSIEETPITMSSMSSMA